MNTNLLSSLKGAHKRPDDLIISALSLVWLLLVLAVVLATNGLLSSLNLGLSSLLSNLPQSTSIAVAAILGALPLAISLVIAAIALFTHRALLFLDTIAAVILTVLLAVLLNQIVEQKPINEVMSAFGRVLEPSAGQSFPSFHAALLSALALILGPYLDRRQGLISWILVVVLSLAQIYARGHLFGDFLGGLALGTLVGSVVNLLVGVPEPGLPPAAIREVFEKRQIELSKIAPVSADARGSVPYFATASDGQEYFIKVLGAEQRNADFIFKLIRSAILKNLPGAAPFLTPMQQIEHEAYVTLLAQKNGVRTPEVEFTASLPGNFALLAQKRVKGQTLDGMDQGKFSSRLLSEIWNQINLLHDARIAHGDLRLANILLDEKAKPWLIDFGFAAAGAEDGALAQDTAQLLASLSPIVGEENAVSAARNALGPDSLIEAVPGLKPLALSSATRQDLKEDPKLLKEITKEIKQETGEELPEQESVFRIRRRDLILVLGLGIGIYALLPQLVELNQVVKIWGQANPGWVLAGLAGSLLTYVAAAIAQMGAVEKGLYWLEMVVVQFAATFASRFGPAGVGGAYVNERYIERQGVDRTATVTALTINGVIGSIIHFILTFIVLSIVGFSGIPFLKDIKPWQIAVAAGVVALFAWYFLRSAERVRKLRKTLRSSLRDLVVVLRQPRKAVELVGGSFAITSLYIVTLYLALLALGVNIPFVNLAAVYLAGSIVGSASPTPGGLGLIESAFAAGLITFGVQQNQAVAGVLLYRLITFWLPTLPGLVAFRYLKRTNKI